MTRPPMPRRSIFYVAICVLVAALSVWSVAGGAVKVGKAKGDKTPNEGSGSTDSRGETARGEPAAKSEDGNSTDEESDDNLKPVPKTDREWKRLLSVKEYRVTRQKETEAP